VRRAGRGNGPGETPDTAPRSDPYKKAHWAAAALKAGSVWINCYNIYDAASPFGGYKESGFGREMGHYNLDLFTQVKSVWVDLS
jgi:aldehyde dehydrogenase (NAD+)